jgi:ribonuclease G
MHWRPTSEAAEEIARQLRLRDLGGIIVVDFIDMKLPENKRKLMEKMEEYMKPDRAKHAVLPISKFGIMQITRQRMKPEVNINTQEVCPSCNGTGKISSTLLLEDEIEKNLTYLITHKNQNLKLVCINFVRIQKAGHGKPRWHSGNVN